jgi:hypothetical protein
MLRSKYLARLLFVAASAGFVASACLGGEPPPSAQRDFPDAGTPPTARVVVTGKKESLPVFHDALVKQLGQPTIQQAGVGCVGCDAPEMNAAGEQTRTYTFVPRPDTFGKFGLAWSQATNKDLTLTFSDKKKNDQDCGACTTNYVCPQLGNCSKSRFACQQCP